MERPSNDKFSDELLYASQKNQFAIWKIVLGARVIIAVAAVISIILLYQHGDWGPTGLGTALLVFIVLPTIIISQIIGIDDIKCSKSRVRPSAKKAAAVKLNQVIVLIVASAILIAASVAGLRVLFI
ncbi:hypothetical protein FWG76_00165 [Candidatus Saccharibacteria bacterium]|nr:hypothetical protein [Candidatus Saccharibacteria bacterium]